MIKKEFIYYIFLIFLFFIYIYCIGNLFKIKPKPKWKSHKTNNQVEFTIYKPNPHDLFLVKNNKVIWLDPNYTCEEMLVFLADLI